MECDQREKRSNKVYRATDKTADRKIKVEESRREKEVMLSLCVREK